MFKKPLDAVDQIIHDIFKTLEDGILNEGKARRVQLALTDVPSDIFLCVKFLVNPININ